MNQELYLVFDDYVVIEAIHQLSEERRTASTRNVRDRFNVILRQRPQLAYVTHEIKSHTTVAQSFARLKAAELIETRTVLQPFQTVVRLAPAKFVAFYEEMHRRFGHNILRWPYKIPKGPNGPDWDGTTFVHISIEE